MIDKHARNVLEEVFQERMRQLRKWGVENQPHATKNVLNATYPEAQAANDYKIPSESEIKQTLKEAAGTGEITWGHILLEEVIEAISASQSKEQMRAELVQVAAVATAWIQQIDRESNCVNSSDVNDGNYTECIGCGSLKRFPRTPGRWRYRSAYAQDWTYVTIVDEGHEDGMLLYEDGNSEPSWWPPSDFRWEKLSDLSS